MQPTNSGWYYYSPVRRNALRNISYNELTVQESVCVYIYSNGSLWYCVPLTSSNCNYSFMGIKSKNTQVGSLVHSKFKFRPCKFLIPISIKYKYISFRSVINSFTVSCSNSYFALIFDYFFFSVFVVSVMKATVFWDLYIYTFASPFIWVNVVFTLFILNIVSFLMEFLMEYF